MADGHHWFPEAVRKRVAELLSPEAYNIFERSVTGNPYALPHNTQKLGGISAFEYNAEVEGVFHEQMAVLGKGNKLVNGKMTGPQAEAFVKRLKTDGFRKPKIKKYNFEVLKSLRLAALAGIVTAGIQEAVKAQGLVNQVKESQNYKKALEALRRSDWRSADRFINGGGVIGNNVVTDLMKAGYETEALILQDKWDRRKRDFMAIEAGRPVPGVPTEF